MSETTQRLSPCACGAEGDEVWAYESTMGKFSVKCGYCLAHTARYRTREEAERERGTFSTPKLLRRPKDARETELEKQMLREVRQLVADLEGGREPANPAVARAVRDQVDGQMQFAARLRAELAETTVT